MNKQNFFRILSLLGFLFLVFLAVGYFITIKNQGELIEERIEVPDDFARYFSRVLSKNRYAPMEQATFMSPDNRRMNWKMFEGQYLLVNFWATWCPPCVLELPSLGRLQEKFMGKGLEVIAISTDQGRPHEDIKVFLEHRGIGEFAAYLDDAREVSDRVYMRGIPTSYLLDPEGNILHIFEGDAVWDSPPAINFFKTLLNK